MKKILLLRLFALLSLLLVSACAEHEVRKEYLQSREVAPMQLPANIDPRLLPRKAPAHGLTETELQALDPDALIKPPEIVDVAVKSSASKEDSSRLPLTLKRDDAGVSYLLVEAEYDVVWREIRLSLVATGFTLTDKNRSDGLFYIRYRDPDDEREEYVIQLIRAAGGSRVLIRSVEGNILATEAATRILSLLKANL